jgi:pimeloyl-ACP methyl ester carboxylesterase
MISPMEKVCEITNIYGTFKGSLNQLEKNQADWIIFLHGFPDDSSVWSNQWDDLKDTFNIWCPDLYNHQFTDQVKGIADFISTLPGNKNVILVGHDMGGPVACEIARKFPDNIQKVLLINTLSLGLFLSQLKDPRQWFKSSYMPLFMGPLHSTKWWRKFSANFLKLAYDRGGVDKNDPLRMHSPDSLEGIKRYREALKMISFDLVSPKNKVKVDTHFLFGEKDPFLTIPEENELTKHYQHFSKTIVSGSHWLQRTNRKEVTYWIQRTASNG